MENLKKLLFRFNEMDVTEQINIFNDPFLPGKAKEELNNLETRLVQCGTANDELTAQLAEAQAKIADLQDQLNLYADRDR